MVSSKLHLFTCFFFIPAIHFRTFRRTLRKCGGFTAMVWFMSISTDQRWHHHLSFSATSGALPNTFIDVAKISTRSVTISVSSTTWCWKVVLKLWHSAKLTGKSKVVVFSFCQKDKVFSKEDNNKLTAFERAAMDNHLFQMHMASRELIEVKVNSAGERYRALSPVCKLTSDILEVVIDRLQRNRTDPSRNIPFVQCVAYMPLPAQQCGPYFAVHPLPETGMPAYTLL